MSVVKYDWDRLKADYMISRDATLRAFCIRRGLGDPSKNAYIGRMTSGWAGERELVKKEATQKFIQMASDELMLDTKQVRLEHAKIAADVIKKAAEYLLSKTAKINSVEQARKLLETGVKIQRDALGIRDNAGKDSKLTQINIDMSRFGIEEANEEELINIIGAIRNARRKLVNSPRERSEEETG